MSPQTLPRDDRPACYATVKPEGFTGACIGLAIWHAAADKHLCVEHWQQWQAGKGT